VGEPGRHARVRIRNPSHEGSVRLAVRHDAGAQSDRLCVYDSGVLPPDIHRVRAKVCGNRNAADIAASVSGGADAIGLICGVTHVSEDALSPDDARELAGMVPPYVTVVLVTHLKSATEIVGLADHVGANSIQLHGEIDPSVTASVRAMSAPGRRVTQAIHVTGEAAIDRVDAFLPYCDGILLDSRTEDRLGGTGITHDWTVSRRIADRLRVVGMPTILAGGLRPENVRDAIATVAPYAVDVNSGVDGEAGDKSPQRIAEFMAALESAARLPAPA
jgi:phosphoribosylanthranilate isomerase